MQSFEGKVAVVTGGGTGMGRSLVRQLAREGCHVATCDVIEENLTQTLEIAQKESPDVTISMHLCDVGVENDVTRFAEEVGLEHKTNHVDLLFNNAGIGGGGSFVIGPRADWERTFAICWYGVYWNTREFMPLLMASEEAHIVNTSSVNGFWASLGPEISHTAYSTAKFAVKGFSESLITDLRLNAPHISVSVVMPGHIGTSIAINSSRILGNDPFANLSDDGLEQIKQRWISQGMPIQNESLEQIKERIMEMRESFRDNAPTSADQAAEVILQGVKDKRWRILVGADAKRLDDRVRLDPETVYDASFSMRSIVEATK